MSTLEFLLAMDPRFGQALGLTPLANLGEFPGGVGSAVGGVVVLAMLMRWRDL